MVSHYCFILFDFLDPENHILDTENHLSIIYRPWDNKTYSVGGHFGRHLEFWTPATGERHPPPIFENPRQYEENEITLIF